MVAALPFDSQSVSQCDTTPEPSSTYDVTGIVISSSSQQLVPAMSSSSNRQVLAPIDPKQIGLRLRIEDCDAVAPGPNSKVRDIAHKLENVLMSPDTGGSAPGQWMMGRQPANPKLSRRSSSNSIAEPTFCPRPLSNQPLDNHQNEQFAANNVHYVPSRANSPSKPNSNRHASQSLQEFREIYSDSHAALQKLMRAAIRRNKSLFRRRGTFTARLMDTRIALSLIEGYWKKFDMLLNSHYTNEATPGSMLSSVLVMLVEGRQTFLDLFNFGKSLGKTYKDIVANELVDLLLTTLQRLQKQRDNLLYFVGHRRAARATANGTMRRISDTLRGEIEKGTLPQMIASPIVNGPLLLLRDRLVLCAGGEDIGSMFPEIHQIEGAVASFSMQNYEEWTTLLFEADTIGSAVMDLAKSEIFRYQLYTTFTQVFVCARSNALASLSREHSLSLVG